MKTDKSLTASIKATLRYRFNHAAAYEIEKGQKVAVLSFHFGQPWRLPYLGFSQPPVVFENRCGMSGLSERYVLPPGLLPRELQEFAITLRLKRDLEDATPFDQKRLRNVWDRLVKDNPETLGALRFDVKDTYQVYHAILGAASAFKPADIQFWLDGGTGVTLRQEPETQRLLGQIEGKLGHVGWVPCLATLQDIDSQMKEKFKSAANQNHAPDARPGLAPPRNPSGFRFRL